MASEGERKADGIPIRSSSPLPQRNTLPPQSKSSHKGGGKKETSSIILFMRRIETRRLLLNSVAEALHKTDTLPRPRNDDSCAERYVQLCRIRQTVPPWAWNERHNMAWRRLLHDNCLSARTVLNLFGYVFLGPAPDTGAPASVCGQCWYLHRSLLRGCYIVCDNEV